MSVSVDNLHLNPAIIDNVSTIVGSDPIAILEDYVVDTLGGTFDYLDLAGTSYDPGTGAVTGNVTFGNSLWTVTSGTAYVRTLPGSTFPYLEIPYGTTLTQDVAGTVFLEGTNRDSTQYFLDQFYQTGLYFDTPVYNDNSGMNISWANAVRFMKYLPNDLDSVSVENNQWHVSRRRMKWNAGFGKYAISTGSTYDATGDTWTSTGILSGIVGNRCGTLNGVAQAGNKSLIACVITVLNDTVETGSDATIKTLLRNATKLALSGGIWP